MGSETVGKARGARKLQDAPNGARHALRPRAYSPPSARGLRCVRRPGRPRIGAKGRSRVGLEPRRSAQLVLLEPRRSAQLVFAFLDYGFALRRPMIRAFRLAIEPAKAVK